MVETSPILLAVFAMVMYGLWSVFAKLATQSLPPEITLVLSYGSAGLLVLGYVVVFGDPPDITVSGVKYALLSGVVVSIGTLAYYKGLRTGNTALVTTITALFFVVTSLIGILFLGESVGFSDAIGFVLATAAVIFIAI
ncbi:EamA family transporter [Natrinema longum]|uniref:EamA family transporter n=1 Tax=Natrinema longum TaxID=370324 RepID=UPI001CCD31CD|nr:EamA family transporter [Natrinema longum]MBZ6496964.1 EamA family transporter [Natrinema longum]